ncbi:hypothetical protein AAKU52_002583 [Pedobacter sp. CG_S7]|uniref:DUF6876 family protein n=1 Tax=Pedobacter sp. CG_S7 TaxID=3143930 RepID=UPI003392A0ED
MEQSKSLRNLNDELGHFYGTESYYRHASRLVYTDGVQHVAETFGAYWLLDEILFFITPKFKEQEEFQVWKLEREIDSKFKITCDDGNGNILMSKTISFSDFDADIVTFFFENDTLCLPSER